MGEQGDAEGEPQQGGGVRSVLVVHGVSFRGWLIVRSMNASSMEAL
jgi:hypothetical protein